MRWCNYSLFYPYCFTPKCTCLFLFLNYTRTNDRPETSHIYGAVSSHITLRPSSARPGKSHFWSQTTRNQSGFIADCPQQGHLQQQWFHDVSWNLRLRCWGVSFGYNGSSYNEYHEYHCSSNYGTGDYNDTGEFSALCIKAKMIQFHLIWSNQRSPLYSETCI